MFARKATTTIAPSTFISTSQRPSTAVVARHIRSGAAAAAAAASHWLNGSNAPSNATAASTCGRPRPLISTSASSVLAGPVIFARPLVHPFSRALATASGMDGSAASSGANILASYPGKKFEGNDVANAMELLAKADAVCFDVDSTVIDEEGIDVLADTLGKGVEVSAWTAKAMGGNVKFEDALAARLEIIKPSRQDIFSCLEKHPLRLSDGVDRLVKALHSRGTDVYLVSGGFRLMIEPVADVLSISHDRIFANTINFDENGDYTGFDADEPTSADQGKPKALAKIKAEMGYDTMIMVGDGATDAQAKPPADAFIGYGGVVTRDAVKEKACWFVEDFETMIDIVTRQSKN